MPLMSINPPSTLSVVDRFQSDTGYAMGPAHNWTSRWVSQIGSVIPSALVQRTLLQNALNMDIPSFNATGSPHPNSTYHLQFYGPTVRCDKPNSIEQSTFRVNHQWKDGYQVLSAYLILNTSSEVNFRTYDHLRLRYILARHASSANLSLQDSIVQFWVQPDQDMWICTLHNASFNIIIDHHNGVQTVTHNSIEVLEKISYRYADVPYISQKTLNNPSTPCSGFRYLPQTNTDIIALPGEIFISEKADEPGKIIRLICPNSINVSLSDYSLEYPMIDQQQLAYITLFMALQDLLSGSLTIPYGQSSSKIMSTGLYGCDDIAQQSLIVNSQPSHYPSGGYVMDVVKGEPWMCRNKSLPRAIEDLANNITISMLTSKDLT